MPTRFSLRFQRAALTVLVCFGLLLAACTRSATTATVPTAGATGAISSTEGVTQPSDQDATMNAVGTQVSGQLTQTAVASGTGAGQGQTPGAPGNSSTPSPETPQPGVTETAQVPVGQPTDTQAAEVPTQPNQPAATESPASPAAASTPCPNPYTVQSGDWIYKIARNCGVSVSALLAANPAINPDVLTPGQQLNMPGPGATPAGSDPAPAGCAGQHMVTTGETLYRLAYTCGLTVEQLAAANNITYPYTIYVGQVLNIP